MSLVSGPGRGGGGAAGPAGTSFPDELSLYVNKHVKYIQSLDTRKDELEYWLTEHLRINGVYWGLTALNLLGAPDGLPRDETIAFVLSCWHDNGGFGAAPGHDPHMLSTCSAVQILATVDALDELDKADPEGKGKLKVGNYIASLQTPTGTFQGDEYGETDTRFLYCACVVLSLLHLLPLIDTRLAISHIVSCANPDGGFGLHPSAESHAGQIFTCVGALAILSSLDQIPHPALLARWLSERQLPHNGGLNGRPEKLEDVCYSWWVFASLSILGKQDWIDGEKLRGFILRCQDPEMGGIADRPGDVVDVFHTCFGVAGLALLGEKGVAEVDPVYCMPRVVTRRVLGR